MNSEDFRQVAIRAAVGEAAKWTIRGLTVFSGLLFTWLWSTSAWTSLGAAKWILGIFLAGIFTISILALTRRTSIYITRYPSVSFRYEILEKTIIYCIDENGHLAYSRKMRIKALHGQVDNYIDRFIWTGGQIVIPNGGPGLIGTEKLDRVGIWTYFRVYFDHSLQKGEEYEFEIKWPPIETWKTSSPFLSTSTDEPTRKIVFDLRFPASEVGAQLLMESMRGIEATYPFKTTSATFDGGRYLWEIKRPPLYMHYRARWTWSGSPVLQMKELLQVTTTET